MCRGREGGKGVGRGESTGRLTTIRNAATEPASRDFSSKSRPYRATPIQRHQDTRRTRGEGKIGGAQEEKRRRRRKETHIRPAAGRTIRHRHRRRRQPAAAGRKPAAADRSRRIRPGPGRSRHRRSRPGHRLEKDKEKESETLFSEETRHERDGERSESGKWGDGESNTLIPDSGNQRGGRGRREKRERYAQACWPYPPPP